MEKSTDKICKHNFTFDTLIKETWDRQIPKVAYYGTNWETDKGTREVALYSCKKCGEIKEVRPSK